MGGGGDEQLLVPKLSGGIQGIPEYNRAYARPFQPDFLFVLLDYLYHVATGQ